MDIGFTYRDYVNKRQREARGGDIGDLGAEELFSLGMCCYWGTDAPRDLAKAGYYLRMALDMDLTAAHAVFAEFYSHGVLTERDPEKAFRHASIAAERGDAVGMFSLARLYLLGEGVEKDSERAFELCKRSAELNCNAGIMLLGYMYLHGEGCKRDEALALKHLMRAAERNNDSAMYWLGVIYARGLGVSKDLERAKLWLVRCVARGSEESPRAKELLDRVIATITEQSRSSLTHKYFGFTPSGNPDTDPHRHDHFYAELHRAALDDPYVDGNGQDFEGEDEYSLYCRSVLLRRRVFDGTSSLADDRTRKMLTESIDLLHRASDMGLGAASYALAAIYKSYPTYVSGYDYGNANNYLHSFIKLSAEQNYAEGLYAYAYLLDTGLGVTPDRDLALYYYYRAYRSGNTNGAVFWYYLSESDKQRAVRLFREREIENVLVSGDADTLLMLADATMNDGMERDYKTALRLLERARELGDSRALYPIAICHIAMGDTAAAAAVLIEAASEGHPRAAYEVGHHIIHSVSPSDATVHLPYGALAEKHIPDGTLISMLECAAAAGIADAARDLGIFFRERKDTERALNWFGAALRGGITDCAYDIGAIYYRQTGNLGNAIQYFESVADTNAYAAFDLANIARHVQKDYPRAKIFYEKARSVLLAEGKSDSYLAKQIDSTLADYRANECPSCHSYFSATEKRGLFGVRLVCSVCGKRLS